MKVEKSAIYRLTVSADCGCVAYGEYSDAAYKKGIGTVEFKPCPLHDGAPGLELIANVLKEVVLKEASEALAPAPPSLPAPVRAPVSTSTGPVVTTLTAEEAERRADRVSGVKVARQPGQPAPATGAPASLPVPTTPLKPGVPQRVAVTPQANRPKPAAGPAGPTPRVHTANGVQRLDPNQRRTAGGVGRSAGASTAATMDMDMEMVDEDSRVTNLLEETGFLDLGDEGDE